MSIAARSRTDRAREVLATVRQWKRGVLRDTGKPVWVVPSASEPGTRYLVNGEFCTCIDWQRRRGREPLPEPCKHMLSVEWFEDVGRSLGILL